MTTTTTGATTNTGTSASALAGTLASTRAELLRLRKWPAVWVTIGAWLALTTMFGYLFDYLSYKTCLLYTSPSPRDS